MRKELGAVKCTHFIVYLSVRALYEHRDTFSTRQFIRRIRLVKPDMKHIRNLFRKTLIGLDCKVQIACTRVCIHTGRHHGEWVISHPLKTWDCEADALTCGYPCGNGWRDLYGGFGRQHDVGGGDGDSQTDHLSCESGDGRFDNPFFFAWPERLVKAVEQPCHAIECPKHGTRNCSSCEYVYLLVRIVRSDGRHVHHGPSESYLVVVQQVDMQVQSDQSDDAHRNM